MSAEKDLKHEFSMALYALFKKYDKVGIDFGVNYILEAVCGDKTYVTQILVEATEKEVN